jgi:hypothetical protein
VWAGRLYFRTDRRSGWLVGKRDKFPLRDTKKVQLFQHQVINKKESLSIIFFPLQLHICSVVEVQA